jgi:hypothetical protein
MQVEQKAAEDAKESLRDGFGSFLGSVKQNEKCHPKRQRGSPSLGQIRPSFTLRVTFMRRDQPAELRTNVDESNAADLKKTLDLFVSFAIFCSNLLHLTFNRCERTKNPVVCLTHHGVRVCWLRSLSLYSKKRQLSFRPLKEKCRRQSFGTSRT